MSRWIWYTYMYGERHLVSMHDKEDDRGLNLGCLINSKALSVELIFMDRFEDHKNIKKKQPIIILHYCYIKILVVLKLC